MDQASAQTFIKQNFTNVILDYPWEDSPEYFVYRHADNRKWCALFMTVNRAALHLNHASEQVYILNLKSDPDLIEELIKRPGFLPAYHMNKKYWITVILDGTVKESELAELIALSFDLTS